MQLCHTALSELSVTEFIVVCASLPVFLASSFAWLFALLLLVTVAIV